MKRLNKGLLVTSGICGGLGLALLICGMLLGGIRGGNDLVDIADSLGAESLGFIL